MNPLLAKLEAEQAQGWPSPPPFDRRQPRRVAEEEVDRLLEKVCEAIGKRPQGWRT